MSPNADFTGFLDLTAMARNSDGTLPREEDIGMLDNNDTQATQSSAGRKQSLSEQYGIETTKKDPSAIQVEHSGVVAESAKAICLETVDADTGLPTDEWFPKAVCKNLEETTILVWEKFLQDAKPHLYELYADKAGK